MAEGGLGRPGAFAATRQAAPGAGSFRLWRSRPGSGLRSAGWL